MFLQSLDLTTALRPALLPDESLLLVQDSVGLYEGTNKLPHHQDGHAYLTTHRACYVDNQEPRKRSVTLDLKSIDRCDFYAGFLRSSAKVTLYPKSAKASDISLGTIGPSQPHRSRGFDAHDALRPYSYDAVTGSRSGKATWICQICSFSNVIPPHFEPASANEHTPLPPCQSCGIKPPFAHILKASIVASAGPRIPPDVHAQAADQSEQHSYNYSAATQNQRWPDDAHSQKPHEIQCSRCTFLNHISLASCELCGASLKPQDSSTTAVRHTATTQSRAPAWDREEANSGEETACIKFSFHAGGEKIFYERLRGALTQRKWLLQSAPPIPPPVNGGPASNTLNARLVGIAGLERRGLELRQKNEAVIGGAFEDLDALMASAKEIIVLAESFADKSEDGSTTNADQLLAESAISLDMVTTKDIAGDESLYLSEMSRNLAEYLTDDSKGILRKQGGIISVVDLWAIFNRARDGVDLVSPTEFGNAARMWEKLKLPVRLRQFKNGLLVVQQAERTDDKTIAQLLNWLQETHSSSLPIADVCWDQQVFGRGITAQDTAHHFGWSLGVASEELEMAEDYGALCRDGEGAAGVTYWENWIVEHSDNGEGEDGIVFKGAPGTSHDDEIMNNLKEIGII